MNITKSKLKQIIKEEIVAILEDDSWAVPSNVQPFIQHDKAAPQERSLSLDKIRALKDPVNKIINARLDGKNEVIKTQMEELAELAESFRVPESVNLAIEEFINAVDPDFAHLAKAGEFAKARNNLLDLLREE